MIGRLGKGKRKKLSNCPLNFPESANGYDP